MVSVEDVKICADNSNARVWIFQVDPTGLLVSDVVFGHLGTIKELVAWAYNLGYENGLKKEKE